MYYIYIIYYVCVCDTCMCVCVYVLCMYLCIRVYSYIRSVHTILDGTKTNNKYINEYNII